MKRRHPAAASREIRPGRGLILYVLLGTTTSLCAAFFDPAAWPGASSLLLARLPAGILAGSGAALVARASGAATTGGATAGAIVATMVWSAAGWRGFILLGAFVALASGATRWRAGLDCGAGARGAEGPRGCRQALANTGASTLLSLLAIVGRLDPAAVLVAFTASLATALSDTVATEAGQAVGGKTVLITTWRFVPPGTGGGISLAGTLAGLASSLFLALLAWGVGFLELAGLPVVALSGLAGNLVDSILGATIEARGLIENDAVNFLATVAGAVCAFALWRILY